MCNKMEKLDVEVFLSDTNTTLKDWKKGPCSTLPELIMALQCVKQSINNSLTDLIQQKSATQTGAGTRDQNSEDIDDEKDECEGDVITRLIKEIVKVKTEINPEKRKNTEQRRAKKLKK